VADEKNGKFFCVRDLPEATKKKIKVYAAENDVTMAQAVEKLVMIATADTNDNAATEIPRGYIEVPPGFLNEEIAASILFVVSQWGISSKELHEILLLVRNRPKMDL